LPEFDHDANSATPDINLFPIVITDGGTGSDRIAIRYGRTESGGIPIKVTVALGTNAMVVNNMGCQAGNWAVISAGGTMSAGGNCAVVKVKDSLAPLATRSNWTQIELESIPTQLSGSIACLGSYKKDPPYDGNSSPLEYLYWVDNGVLVQGGNPATSGSGTPVGEGIVNIQAQYGVSAIANSNQITQWVNASGATWATPSMANRNRIKAIRLAIVARDGMLEKTDVTNACSSTTAANPTGLCTWDATSAAPSIDSPAPAINLTADPDWQRYRYRVFETIIPLRNMIWSKVTFKP
jgi:type IV pilus assembly protein PilW